MAAIWLPIKEGRRAAPVVILRDNRLGAKLWAATKRDRRHTIRPSRQASERAKPSAPPGLGFLPCRQVRRPGPAPVPKARSSAARCSAAVRRASPRAIPRQRSRPSARHCPVPGAPAQRGRCRHLREIKLVPQGLIGATRETGFEKARIRLFARQVLLGEGVRYILGLGAECRAVAQEIVGALRPWIERRARHGKDFPSRFDGEFRGDAR